MATMLDNGQNGDQTAGDRVFSTRVSLLESQTGSKDFFVSAAFRGILRRPLSPALTVTVVQASQTMLSANGVSFQYPSDFLLSTSTPHVGEMYDLTNHQQSSTSGVGGYLPCTILVSTNSQPPNQPIATYISEHSRTDGTDSAVSISGRSGIRKTYTSELANEPAVMVFLNGLDRVHVFSTVGASCISVMDQVLQTISF